MFHLLVAYQGWPDSGGTLSTSRFYIREDDPVGSRFCSNGQLNLEKLKQYPALLVTETGGEWAIICQSGSYHKCYVRTLRGINSVRS